MPLETFLSTLTCWSTIQKQKYMLANAEDSKIITQFCCQGLRLKEFANII